MIDIKFLRENPELVKENIKKKFQDSKLPLVDEVIELADAVLALPLNYREVIVFYYYKEMKIEEIATLLECSTNTVKTRLRRGREKLKISLEGSGLHERIEY